MRHRGDKKEVYPRLQDTLKQDVNNYMVLPPKQDIPKERKWDPHYKVQYPIFSHVRISTKALASFLLVF